MKITNVRIENFLTIGEISCRLDDKGLVLIQGENEDDSSQTSNGSGKSSFADAVMWCLYGVTARGDSGDSVVNRHVGRNCMVKLNVVDGADVWTVTRARKHKVLKNSVNVEQHLPDGSLVCLTDGTAALTQAKIEQIMGCSAEVFSAAIYAGQERMPDLPAMTDKMLKVLVEEAAGVNRLQAAFELAQIELKGAQADLNQAKRDIEALDARMATASDDVVTNTAEADDWELNRKGAVAKITADMKAQAAVLKGITLADKTPYEQELAEVQARIAGIDREKTELDNLNFMFNRAERDFQLANRDAATAVSEAKSLKAALESNVSLVGTACDECGKPFDEHDLESVQAHVQKQYDEALAVAKARHTKAVALREALEIARSARDAYKAGMTDVSAEIARERTLRATLTDIERDRKLYEHKREMLKLSESQRQARLAETNPYTTMIDRAKKQLEEATELHEKALKAKDVYERELFLWESVAECFGRAGVRAHILDTVTPFLNERTNEYLGTLTDGNITAVWSTVSVNAKGEYKENFNIEVVSKVGAENFRGLSGGEKRKVRLACSMALQDLVSNRAAKPIDLYVADEIDDALDEQGLERLMSILDEKAKDKGTVLVISHNSLSDWIRQSVTVTKRGGLATLNAGGVL